MGLILKARQYWHFSVGLSSFLKNTISWEQAQETVKWRIAHREERFLAFVQKGIYRYRKSPYLKLLELAGCEFGDMEQMVRSHGIEATLRRLKKEGVYISFEEFKARKPLVRSGRVFHFREQDFDNPYLSYCYQARSSGSTGAGTRANIDLEFLREGSTHLAIRLAAHDLKNTPCAIWHMILPANAGMVSLLKYAKVGRVPLKWFTPLDKTGIRVTLRNRMLTNYIIYMGRVLGLALPRPQFVSLNRADLMAKWLAEMIVIHGSCILNTFVSLAVRICAWAREKGLNLRGVTFFVTGEPLTEVKLRIIELAGAKAVPSYATTELAGVGCGCARPSAVDDVHLFHDLFALIQCSRRIEISDLTVNSFFFTCLSPASPKILLNMEIDDYGVVEKRECGCLLGQLGFTTHLHHIRSFSRLTSEGMTVMGTDLLRIVEEVFPQKFGGDPTSYQIVEEEGSDGLTSVSILVDPKLSHINEEVIKKTFLEETKRVGPAQRIWRQGGTIKVRYAKPLPGRTGKIMPLRIERP